MEEMAGANDTPEALSVVVPHDVEDEREYQLQYHSRNSCLGDYDSEH